jgi:alpha-mannosidase
MTGWFLYMIKQYYFLWGESSIIKLDRKDIIIYLYLNKAKKMDRITKEISMRGGFMQIKNAFRYLLFVFVISIVTFAQTPGDSSYFANGVIHLISSSHQDIGWENEPDWCAGMRDSILITPALNLMSENPRYCYSVENVISLIEYLQRHPDRLQEIRQRMLEGRLEWGATYNQPYESMYAGEALIRQVYLGRKQLKKLLPGCDSRIAYNPDVPGRAMQMPQILAKAGIPYLFMSRHQEGCYRWLSPDGSGIYAYSPGHYMRMCWALLNFDRFNTSVKAVDERVEKINQELDHWASYYQKHQLGPHLPVILSADMLPPLLMDTLINTWNEKVPQTMLKYSTMEQFMENIFTANPRLDIIKGERPNLWLYIHGPTHHRALSAGRDAWRLLPAAETFAVIACLLDKDLSAYPLQRINRAWADAIYPDHGWGGKNGHITDRLFLDKLTAGRDTAKIILKQSLMKIAGKIQYQQEGIPLVVFNSLSWKRSDPVICSLPFDGRANRVNGAHINYSLTDSDGNRLPYQVIPDNDDEAQGEESTRFLFIAENVPSLGYKTFYFRQNPLYQDTFAINSCKDKIVENQFYRIELGEGGINSIYDKELEKELLKKDKFLGGELFSMHSEGFGAGEFPQVQQPTMEGFEKLSMYRPGWICLESGPVRTVVETAQKIQNCTARLRVLLYHELKRIDFEVDLLGWNGSKNREFRIAFPLNLKKAQIAYHVPMGVAEVGKSEMQGAAGLSYTQSWGSVSYPVAAAEIHPREVQNWFHASDGETGVTVSSSVAVFDWIDPTDTPTDYPLLQPILLASRVSCHQEGNWYLQPGNHHYKFSLYSHKGDWRGKGRQLSSQASHPLIALADIPETIEPILPVEKSFFSHSKANIEITAIKKCEDDDTIILRCVEMEGSNNITNFNSSFAIKKVEKTNIIEEEGQEIPADSNKFQVSVGHHAIETFKVFIK